MPAKIKTCIMFLFVLVLEENVDSKVDKLLNLNGYLSCQLFSCNSTILWASAKLSISPTEIQLVYKNLLFN